MAPDSDQPRNLMGKILAWPLSFAASLVCLFVGFGLTRTIPVFANLFAGLGVNVPLPTRFLIATYFWLCPLLFGGLAFLTIAKEFWIHETRRRLFFSGIIFLAAFSSVGLVYFILNLPLLDLIRKLNETK